jgi:hypothetical protein
VYMDSCTGGVQHQRCVVEFFWNDMLQTNIVEKYETHFMFSNYPPLESHIICEKMKNMIQLHRLQMTR